MNAETTRTTERRDHRASRLSSLALLVALGSALFLGLSTVRPTKDFRDAHDRDAHDRDAHDRDAHDRDAHDRDARSESGAVPVAAGVEAEVGQVLSGIDFVPSRDAIDGHLGDSAEAALIAIARGEDTEMADPGMRIRAYRALGLYPSEQTEAVLRSAVAEHGSVPSGVDTLYLRAAMDSLARVASTGSVLSPAVSTLAPMLNHAARDVRASAARALGATGDPTAVPVLRARMAREDVLQVRLAISDALRLLDNRANQGNGGTH